MKKKLDTSGVMNELRGQSVFFPAPQSEQPREQQPQLTQEPEPTQEVKSSPPLTNPLLASEKASIDESMLASMLAWCLASNHASKLALDSKLNVMSIIVEFNR